MPSAPSKTTPFRLKMKERNERALQMRIDGYSLGQIADALNIDRGNLGKYFREYKNEEIKELHGELFDMQTARLMELWQNVVEDMRKFVPVLDAKGEAIKVPVLGRDGQPVLDADGEPVQEYMRDLGVHLNAVNVAAKITERIARHFGTDSPTKVTTAFESIGDGVTDREYSFRVVDAGAGHPLLQNCSPEELLIVLRFVEEQGFGQGQKLIEGSQS